ncbi:hypothetical protein L7F22_050611 [Adiantum nelumboides]|nr:hypothetical protein [Adiantum nelumboides]
MHMLLDDWHHSWLALKFSLLMRYWRLSKPNDPIESSLVATFNSLEDEFWEMLQSPSDVDAYCNDNACCLSNLHAKRGLQIVDDTSIKLFDGDDVSKSGYCSNFESDDYSASLFFADDSMDDTPCDGAFVDGESFCDDPATFYSFWYMREIKTRCPDQAHSANERDQVLESVDRQECACSLPLATDVDDGKQSDDASDAYANEVDSGAEFGHVCTDMVCWSEADSESKQKGQSNGSMSVPTLEAKVIVMLQELSDVCQHQARH